MTSRSSPWLPPSALGCEALRARVATAVEAWSREWLSSRRLTVVSWSPTTGDAIEGSDATGWRGFAGGPAGQWSRRAVQRVMGHVLDVSLESVSPTPRDLDVMAAVEHEVMTDLLFRVGAALEAPLAGQPEAQLRPLQGHGGVMVGLGDQGGPALVTLALPMRLLAPIVRRDCQAPRPATEPLSALSRILGQAPVTTEVVLGYAALSLPDLRALAPGDVLVLDRALGAPADLRLPDCDAVVARAAVTPTPEGLALTLQPLS